MEELIEKYIKDNKSGDIGQIVELKDYAFKYFNKTIGAKYYLVKWVYQEDNSWHKRSYYAQYSPEKIKEPNGRFEILTGQEAFMWML
jgi:hypothetical protein